MTQARSLTSRDALPLIDQASGSTIGAKDIKAPQMEEINDFVDDRQKSWCVHCGRFLVDLKSNRDHVPTRTFLHPPYPTNLPVIAVCTECNNGFSKDEQYFVAFLSSVISGTTEPNAQLSPAAERILRDNERLRARIERSKTEYQTPAGEAHIVWRPEQDRIDRVIVKNARGHAFFEFGEPMLDRPARVLSMPLPTLTFDERTCFENMPSAVIWPEVGSRMMTRFLTGQDLNGPWVVVQDGLYRYAVTQYGGGLLVRSVMAEYLGTEVFWG
ncbi:hypothetical protein [Azospirillum argentinense]|uniref:HNH endonuclease n=1 Tax=Azospirillum argentinense TaxID=2970906 RepID=A0A5B0KU97_9PROT|nr:hypothetical protein [Azospirillum argentinense]KAA1054434.1 hypothetical protein FH063_006690 [Azospirillum argentinense]